MNIQQFPGYVEIEQINYSHPSSTLPRVWVDDKMIIQFAVVLGSMEVYLLHTLSSYYPEEIHASDVHFRIKWLIEEALALDCYIIRVHDGVGSGVSHDFIRQMLHKEFKFEFLPHVGAHQLLLR